MLLKKKNMLLNGYFFFNKEMNDYQKECCKKFLDILSKEPMTVPLRRPVDPVKDHCPTYLEVIKNPMDLSTMKKKINQNKYESITSFCDDIKLICDNATTFNGPASMLAMVAEDIMREMEEWRKTLCETPTEAWYKNMENSIQKLQLHIKNAPATITFGESLDLPGDFDIKSISDEDRDEIAKLIEPFQIENFKNIWAFIPLDNKEKILELIKK